MIDEKKITEAQEAYFEEEVFGKGEDIIYNDLDGNSMCTEERYGEEHIKIAFEAGVLWTQEYFAKSLWHDASEEPRKGANCILYVSCEFEQNPEDNYHEYTTAVYLGGGFSEDHFPSEADVYTIKWAYLFDILPQEGGEG